MAGPDDTIDEDDWAAALIEQGGGGDASLAEEWGAALAEQGTATQASDMAAEWANMIDEGEAENLPELAGNDRILNQEEIDQVLGFSLRELSASGAGVTLLFLFACSRLSSACAASRLSGQLASVYCAMKAGPLGWCGGGVGESAARRMRRSTRARGVDEASSASASSCVSGSSVVRSASRYAVGDAILMTVYKAK